MVSGHAFVFARMYTMFRNVNLSHACIIQTECIYIMFFTCTIGRFPSLKTFFFFKDLQIGEIGS